MQNFLVEVYSPLLSKANVIREVVVAVLQCDGTKLFSLCLNVLKSPYPSKSLKTMNGCLYLTVPSPSGFSLLLCVVLECALEAILKSDGPALIELKSFEQVGR